MDTPVYIEFSNRDDECVLCDYRDGEVLIWASDATPSAAIFENKTKAEEFINRPKIKAWIEKRFPIESAVFIPCSITKVQ